MGAQAGAVMRQHHEPGVRPPNQTEAFGRHPAAKPGRERLEIIFHMEKDYRYFPVHAQPGAAPYLGGKRQLSKRIIPLIENIPHVTYAEVFVGMGGIFFRRRFRPEQEIINDFGREVSTFFLVLQNHYASFMDMMRFQLSTREEFERLRALPAHRLTDLQRAARFYYLQNLTYGGSPKHSSYGVQIGTGSRFNITKLSGRLEEIHSRLAPVTIERLSYKDFIPLYDSEGALFYLDPPYWDCENDYGRDLFSKSDFHKMARMLGESKGRFILSINDVPETRRLFEKFNIQEVRLTYSVNKDGTTEARELIVSNCDIDPLAISGQTSMI